MKKKNLRKFVLKKRTISNLESGELKGGSSRTSNLCSVVCTQTCPPMSEGCFTQDDASACICL